MPRIGQRILGGLATACVVGGALLAPAAPASAGGAVVPAQSGAAGGTEYGSALAPSGRPVASRFRVAPARVQAGGRLPRIVLRLDEAGVPRVRARIVLWPLSGGSVVRVDLGRVPTGALLRLTFPSGTQLAPGRYALRVHASDPAGSTLMRKSRTPGRVILTVLPKPKPKSKPKPPPPVAPLAPVRPAGAAGTFPVAGAHSFGEGFGVDRGTHTHQGVDILAAEGLAVVAPTAGTVRVTGYQASGAGEYVVLTGTAGTEFFFAHCVRGSTEVAVGQAVAEGRPLCAVGSTGRSTTPHLHFELWPNGWRTGAKDSVATDPLAQLRAWGA